MQQASHHVEIFHQGDDFYEWYYRTSKWLVVMVAGIAALVLVGWTFEIPRLTNLSPAWASMKITTAVGLLLMANSLLLVNPHLRQSKSNVEAWRVHASRLTAVGAGLLGIGTFALYLFGLEDSIAQSGLMAPAAALCFMLLAAAVLTQRGNGQSVYVTQSLTALVIFFCMVALIGYLFNAQSLYAIGPYASMAVHTAACFVMLSLALLHLSPDRGFMQIATASTMGGLMLQHMLPLTVGLIIGIGWLHLMGEKAEWFDGHFGLTLVAGLSLTGFSLILWYVANILNRVDVARVVNEQQLRAAIGQLQVTEEKKTRLLYNMSHEYRTPLNGMVGISTLLLNRVDGPLTPEQVQQVTLLRIGAQQLLALVDTMLDLDTMKTGSVQTSPRYCTAASILESVRSAAGLIPIRPTVSLVVQDPPPLPALNTEPTLLHRILYNFVHNAAKYTEQGTVEIRAEVEQEGGAIRFVVQDSGIGIAGEDLDHIFEEFVQVRHPLQPSMKGQGLGLALCKQLADVLGATIAVESRPGEGSTFSVTVPCERNSLLAVDEMSLGRPMASMRGS